jgi:hypothetical protein
MTFKRDFYEVFSFIWAAKFTCAEAIMCGRGGHAPESFLACLKGPAVEPLVFCPRKVYYIVFVENAKGWQVMIVWSFFVVY